MIDLHLHLDGSLSPKLLMKLASLEGVSLPAKEEKELLPYLSAPEDCASLNEYLEKFDLPVSCIQSEESLAEAGRGLTEELAAEGLLYAEIRFAPQLHLQKGLSQEQVIQAVIRGLQKGREENGLKTGLILCCMRGSQNKKENLETVRLAGDYLNKGVCGLDLAGAEALFPTGQFADLFSLAKRRGIPFTIHAGEASGPQSVWKALEFGAARIGHGVRSVEDPELLKALRERRTTLEICVTSNYQTKAVPAGKSPALALLRQGIAVTANTDNRTVSGTTLAREFARLRDMGMTREEERTLLQNAVHAAFLGPEEKEALWKKVCRRLETS
ncbi:MAG: adenosine deaminase [Lachnospiraceae bacterium]|nr:adenosine deaminase [Lachnospiraceae bacterium]